MRQALATNARPYVRRTRITRGLATGGTTVRAKGGSPMYGVSVTYVSALVAGVLAAAVLAVWPWARLRRRFAIAGITTLVSWIAWHLLLNATQATGFDVDAPIIRVSWEDV